MKISMHAMSHGVFRKALAQLQHVMEKAVANAKARNFETSVLVGSRLAPDMLPFVRQVQLASDFAKNSMARLQGVDPPKFEDNETTMDELFARVKKTIDYIDSVPAASLEGSEDRDIVIKLRDRTVEFKARHPAILPRLVVAGGWVSRYPLVSPASSRTRRTSSVVSSAPAGSTSTSRSGR